MGDGQRRGNGDLLHLKKQKLKLIQKQKRIDWRIGLMRPKRRKRLMMRRKRRF